MTTEEWVRYTPEQLRSLKDETNWALVDSLTDEDVDRVIADDPDWDGLRNLDEIDWSQAELIMPAAKSAISIRLDPDVLAHFKEGGKGYQSRINAVLRSYVKSRQKA